MTKTRGRGQPAFVPTEEKRAVVMALTIFGHKRERVAGYMGISEPTLEKHFANELATAKMSMQAEAISSLAKGLKKGESWAVLYFLRTQGKAFGWSERIALSNDGPEAFFRGLDLSRLTPHKMRQFLELLSLAGADLMPDDMEMLTLPSPSTAGTAGQA